jgi:phosphopantothenoylcysteine decarboxylase / phosphopantothenate---cysteine ligase
MLHNKKILVGVCGSIAAYKSAFLIRLLIKEGAEVKVVMTTSALSFISELTLSTLSKNPVYKDFVKESGVWNNHVELGLWADAIIIAPATANTISKMATGLCDNLLTATYLSARCPVFVAPAMDLDMYLHPSTQNNLKSLISYGNHVIDAETGELASGLYGTGRMAEPENIVEILNRQINPVQRLKNKNILITSGPTREAIDPVRYISNHSTGKMGIELANAFACEGANVTLITGPLSTTTQVDSKVKVCPIVSAAEMFELVKANIDQNDIAVFAAAVADYTPTEVADKKIKKESSDMTLTLKKTEDIAAWAGKNKKPKHFFVGFALETDNEVENASKKLANKNLDLVILNSLQDKGAGFGNHTNKITILDKDNKIQKFELKSKTEVARDIAETLIKVYGVKNS